MSVIKWQQRHWGKHNRSKSITFLVLSQCPDGKYYSIKQIYSLCYGLIPLQTLKNSMPRWSRYKRPYFSEKEQVRPLKVHRDGSFTITYHFVYCIRAKALRYIQNIPLIKKAEYSALINRGRNEAIKSEKPNVPRG